MERRQGTVENLVKAACLILVCTGCGFVSPPQLVTVPELDFFLSITWPQPGERLTLRGLYDPAARALRVVRLQEDRAQIVWYTLDRPPTAQMAYGEARVTIQDGASPALERWRGLPADLASIKRACAWSIQMSEPALQGIAWEALALENYRESTARFRFPPGAAAASDVMLLGIDPDTDEALCRWHGPTLPAQMPLVTRWVVVYPIYSLKAARVVRLVVTIEGQVLE